MATALADPLGIETASNDPLGIERKADPLGLETPAAANIPQLSEYHPTLRQRIDDLAATVRRSQPVESILGRTPDETAQMLSPRPTGLVPNIVNAAKDIPKVAELSPAGLMGDQTTFAGGMNKALLSQVNIENLAMLTGIGEVYKAAKLAQDTPRLAALTKALIGAYFTAQAAKGGAEAAGKVAGTPNEPAGELGGDIANIGLNGVMAFLPAGEAIVSGRVKPFVRPSPTGKILQTPAGASPPTPPADPTAPATAGAVFDLHKAVADLQAVVRGNQLKPPTEAPTSPAAEPEPLSPVQPAETPAMGTPEAGNGTPEAGNPILSPSDLTPALLVDGKPVTSGNTHTEIISSLTPEQKMQYLLDPNREARHVFVDKSGNVLDRIQAAQSLGLKDPLHSETLNALKSSPSAEQPSVPVPAEAASPAALPGQSEPLVSPSIPAKETGKSSLEKVRTGSVDTPAQGSLNQALKLKADTWKRVQSIRQKIKANPIQTGNLRVDLIKAESAHREALQMERDARAGIETRANEQGQTTKPTPAAPAEKPAVVQTRGWDGNAKNLTREQFIERETSRWGTTPEEEGKRYDEMVAGTKSTPAAVQKVADQSALQIGDWIRPKGGALPGKGTETGKIVGEGTIGKQKVPAWKVDAGGGRIAIVPKDAPVELWHREEPAESGDLSSGKLGDVGMGEFDAKAFEDKIRVAPAEKAAAPTAEQNKAVKVAPVNADKPAGSKTKSVQPPISQGAEFQEWFHGSKVVDDTGKPLTVWHGSTKTFTKFNKGDLGFHFGTPEQAREFTELGKESSIRPFILSIKNPLRVDFDTGGWDTPKDILWWMENYSDLPEQTIEKIRDAVEEKDGIDDNTDKAPYDSVVMGKIRAAFEEAGYDGIVYLNTYEGVKGKTKAESDASAKHSYLAFHPDQIRPEKPFESPRSENAATAASPAALPGQSEFTDADKPEGESHTGLGAVVPSEFGESPKTPTGIKNATVDQERTKRGLPAAIEPARRSFGKVWDEAMATVDKDPDAQTRLINELRDKPRAVTDKEDAMLLQRQIDLQNEYGKATRDLAQAHDDAVNAPNEEAAASRAGDAQELKLRVANLSDQLLDLYNINKRVGTESGRGLNARKMMAYEDYSLASMETRLRSAKDGKPLTPEESAQIQRLSETIDRLQKQIDDYEERTTQERPRYSDVVIKIAEKVVNTLDKRADAARQRIRERASRLNAGIDPTMLSDYAEIGASHLAHIGLDFAKWSDAMIKEFGEKIRPNLKRIFEASQVKADNLADEMAPQNPEVKRAVKKQASGNPALKALKTRYANRADELKARMQGNDFEPKGRTPLQLDAEAQKLKAAYENAKLAFDRMAMKERLKNRTMLQKTQDTFSKWRRAFLLSSPVTLAKLTSAAVERLAFTPLEEAMGAAMGKIPGLSGVAERAPREGGLNVKAEARALTQGFTKGMQDSYKTLQTGHSDMDSLFGRRDVMPRSAIDFMGAIHGALKAPVKRVEFERSFEKRADFAIRQGQDMSDPLVQTRTALEAYKDANRSIFMQDNKVSAAWNAGLAILESPDKATGKIPVGRKTLATAGRVLLPIVKVPANIVAETLQTAFGSVTGSARLAHALYKGVETLKPAEADLIMRELKKGSLGAALLVLGFLSPSVIGGYYQMNDKTQAGHPKFGSITIGGLNVPTFLIHNPLLETLQIGATVRHVADSKLRKHDKENQGVASGTMAALLGITSEVPFAREPIELTKMFNPYERAKFENQFAKDLIVPLGVSWVAQHFDKDVNGNYIARDQSTLANTIKSAIPLLRQTVPIDPKASKKLNK